MDENTKKINMKKVAIMISAMLIIIITVLTSSYVIYNKMENQLQKNLEDVANQNSLALHNKIHSNYLLIESLSKKMNDVTPETIDDTLQSLTVFIDKYDLKRFAYAFPDGTSYSTDGGVANLSYREFFKNGMAGKGSITGILEDALDESHGLINVMTIPIYDKNKKVEGVFGLTYDSKVFNEELQIESFDGKGYSCAINSEGQIMVAMGNDVLQLSENLFSDVLSSDGHNKDTINNLKNQMKDNKPCGGVLYMDEKNYYYCTPVKLMAGDVVWYMLTIIPANVLDKRAAPIQMSLYVMAVIVVVCILIGSILVIMLSNEQKKMILQYAYEDPLTGGANYARFFVDMKNRNSRQGYIVTMDITNFNNINIAVGKTAGDLVIGDIWNILKDEIDIDELAAHLKEDVFIMYLKECNKDDLIDKLKKISKRINRRAKELQVKGIHARYGIYFMQGNEKLDDAYSKAQVAREQARTEREKKYVFYDEIDHEKIQQDQQLEERFEDALAAGNFEVWYQPKYSAASGEVVGSEALVRWRDKDGSMISPGRFIPLFERNGMIAVLDEYMFRSVCRQQAQWLAEGHKIYPVSVNLSRASLYFADVVEKYEAIIEEYGINPGYVQIEITESAMEGKSDIRGLLGKFRNMGIQILMDDFGKGYSSLATLNMRCFDTLKLDKSLIDHIGDKNGETLLYYVISMGQQLGLHITAEGVENNMQLEFLKENNCDDIQGFLFARPMPSSQYEQILEYVKI